MTSCTVCGVADVPISSLGRCLACVSAATEANDAKVAAEPVRPIRRCFLGLHADPHSPSCSAYRPAYGLGTGTVAPTYTGRPRERLVGLIDFVLAAGEGERNGRLYWAACRAREMVEAGEVAEDLVVGGLSEAARRVGLGDGEARATIRSGLRGDASSRPRGGAA